MEYSGPLGMPRISGKGPFVKQNVGSIRDLMDPVAEDISITGAGEDFTSVDFRLPLEPKRERKSSVIVLKGEEVFETTLRFPIIGENAMSRREVMDNMEKVLTRANSPEKSKIEIPLRLVSSSSDMKGFNPHIILKNPSDMDIKDYASWVGRLNRAFDNFFPEFVRVAEGD